MKQRGIIFFLVLALIFLLGFTTLNGLNLGRYSIEPVKDSLNLGLDIKGGVVVVYEAQTDKTGEELTRLMSQVKSVMGRRIDEFGLTEPNISVQGNKRLRIELPGVKNAQEALDVIGETAQLEFLLVKEGSMAQEGMTKEDFEYEKVLTGNEVDDSFTTYDQDNSPAVGLEFNAEGETKFFEATQKASQYYGQIAILLDNEVISAPAVETAIPDGSAIITGGFDIERASNLSSLIRGGALPVEMKEIQTSVIGPTLGLDALNKSINAAQIGLLLVMLFLIGYYRLPGLIAALALILYGSLVLLIMSNFGATLTLPGVAGIVLSLGMAVDANVIIFERLKEELQNGKTLRSSLKFGFKRAMSTIVDANFTTFIAGIVLYNFGEGPIKGFAVTLMIGIVVSMFTAIVISRVLLMNGLTFNVFNNKKLYKA